MNLIIEVTRKCNMQCCHCLRGDSQNKNIKLEYITKILENIKDNDIYYDITFSGGEPSLNTQAIRHYINECKRLNINHSYFYIATNGVNNNNSDFIMLLLELYTMSDEKKLCQVQLSNDDYHDDLYFQDDSIINGLSFFNKKYNNDYESYDTINEGRGWGGRNATKHDMSYYDDFQEFINDIPIYLNCNGYLINGCDWSYKSQNRPDLKLCHVDNFNSFYNNNDSKLKIGA